MTSTKTIGASVPIAPISPERMTRAPCGKGSIASISLIISELELELIRSHMAQEPVLRGEVGASEKAFELLNYLVCRIPCTCRSGGGGGPAPRAEERAPPCCTPTRRVFRSGRRKAAKTLTGDFSALSWTQELGLTCLESGRRAASNEPSCFSCLEAGTEGR